ncbi:MAG: ABC transporter permease subunit [Patescibacteria group bacterium]
MRNFFTIFKKELAGYFNSPLAYIFTALFLVVGNWLFWQDFFLSQQANPRYYFALLPWIFLFITPALTMRLWAEEKKNGTIETLLTFPIRDIEAVLAKFFSSLAFLAIVLVLSISIPITISSLGNMDWGAVLGGYLGALFIGALYLAMGLFISSLTKNQIIAFLITVVCSFILFMLSTPYILQAFPWAASLLSIIGSSSHFSNLARGVIDTRDVFYFLTVISLFIYLNKQVLASRNWID